VTDGGDMCDDKGPVRGPATVHQCTTTAMLQVFLFCFIFGFCSCFKKDVTSFGYDVREKERERERESQVMTG
jgi:hypothetical protein